MIDTIQRIKDAWNAFNNRSPTYSPPMGSSYSYRSDRIRFSRGNERTIVTSVYNRIGMDAAAIDVVHVEIDDNKRYLRDVESGLNQCLSLSANVDQTGRALIQDVVMSMLDEGCVALVPVDTENEPDDPDGFDILSLRTGKILEWYPRHVRVQLLNDQTGRLEELLLPKETTCIIENPYYTLMNEPNSTLQRVIRKLRILDVVDEQSGSGKLNLLLHLPYTIKGETRKKQAKDRYAELENQLNNSKYGIAYTDVNEKITQLNRSVDNNLMTQIEYLTELLYSQLGITQSILDGTADDSAMTNYYSRTIEPIMAAISDEICRKFLTPAQREAKESVIFFRDPFKLVPVSQISEMADKFTRNEIMTSNEIRQIVGMKPSDDPSADELRNKNLSQSTADIEEKADNPSKIKKSDENSK